MAKNCCKRWQIYTAIFHTVKTSTRFCWLNRQTCCCIPFNNKAILELFLSAITNSSGGFIAAADPVTWCIFHLLINGAYTLERGLEATKPITVHKRSGVKNESGPSVQNNTGGFHHLGRNHSWIPPSPNTICQYFLPSHLFEALSLIWLRIDRAGQ